MDNKKKDLYDITQYSDQELYEMLDIDNPTDRELEAKILMNIEQYNIDNPEAKKIKKFFEDVYDYFFEDDNGEDESVIEGMETMEKNENKKKEKQTNGKTKAHHFETQADEKLVQTTNLNYSASQLNPLLKETQKRVLQIDSQFRNYENYPSSTDYIVNLSETLHNVVSIRLHSVSIPYTWYNISNVYNANYFQLIGNAEGIRGIYDLSFGIAAGSYDVTGLMNAINTSVQTVASRNTDIEFGQTGVYYNTETSKVTLTLDLQQVYNETNFYLYFNYLTNTFDTSVNMLSIPGFLGYGNLVIPKYHSSNFVVSPDASYGTYISVPNSYSLESIYSNYNYSYNATGKINLAGDPITYNQFDPNASFYVVINDPSNNVIGNNYFTIYNYEGPNNYFSANNVSEIYNNNYSSATDNSSNILQTITVEFGDVSGLYTRATLLETINRSLTTNIYLSSNASLDKYDISYSDVSGNIVTMQRFQLRTLLDRTTSKKQKNSKQIIMFPDEDEVVNNLPQTIRDEYWQGPLWRGRNSCFLFDTTDIFLQPNSVRAENEPVQTLYTIDSNPTMLLQCTKPYYDNSYNNRMITLNTDISAGYPNGYTLNNLIGVYSYGNTYEQSEINLKLNNLRDLNNNVILNGYVNSRAFYDAGGNKCHIQFDIMTSFDETDYTFDLSTCFLNTLGAASTLQDASYGWLPGYNIRSGYAPSEYTNSIISFGSGKTADIPIKNLNPSIIDTSTIYPDVSTPVNAIFYNKNGSITYPFTINSSNNKITVRPKTGIGIENIPSYNVVFKEGVYRTPTLLASAVNKTLSSIQGLTDACGNDLNGLNMANSKFYAYDGSWVLVLDVANKLTQDNYNVVFSDVSASAVYKNNWIDASNNVRYSLDSNGNIQTSLNPGISSSMWNAYLGFTDVSYTIGKSSTGSEIVSSRSVMYDVSKALILYDSRDTDAVGTIRTQNNTISFISQSNVKGLSDASGVIKIEIEIPRGIYPHYYLYNAINRRLSQTNETTNSIVYSYFDTGGFEYTVMQMNINKVYTAEDYILKFFDEESATTNVQTSNTNSFQATTWDVTLGWILGFRSIPTIYLNPTYANNLQYVQSYNYKYDNNTNIITLLGNTCLDLYLFKNLYLILNDYTQNHLNDGLVTGVRNNPNPSRPEYSSSATQICNPVTTRNQSSIFNAIQPGMGVSENQLYAANIIAEDNYIHQITRIYSDPPFVKDMFALIPIKVSGLKQGEVFTEYGGTLQDNDRKYFGPVNISKMNIKLLNDHGDVIDLNGNNWSFSLVFEYLYNLKGI